MKKIIFYVIFVFFSLFIVFGVILFLEIGHRLLFYEPSRGYLIDIELFPYHQYLVSTLPPNMVLGNSNSILEDYFFHSECDEVGGVTARFNSMGFRSPEFTDLPPKKANEFRIIITGGSVSVSWNIGEKCTLDNQLLRLLTAIYPEIDLKIFNLGSVAWKSFQELNAIQLYGLDIQPDLVVTLNGFNDIEHAVSMPINHSYSYGLITLAFDKYKRWIKAGPLDLFKDFKILYFIKGIFSHRETQSENRNSPKYPQYAEKPEPGHLSTRLDSFPVNIEDIRARTDFDPYNRQVVDNYLKNIRLMARSLSTINAQLIVALQPTLYLKNPLSPDEDRKLWDYYKQEVNFVVQGYVRMIDGLTELSEKEPNVTFCDLSKVFDGDNRLLQLDYAHTNPLGYEIIAENLAKTISKYIYNKSIKM